MEPEVKAYVMPSSKGATTSDGCPVECRYCSHHHYLNFAGCEAIPEELQGNIPWAACVRGFVSCDKEAGTVTLKMVSPIDSCWGFHPKHLSNTRLHTLPGFHPLPVRRGGAMRRLRRWLARKLQAAARWLWKKRDRGPLTEKERRWIDLIGRLGH